MRITALITAFVAVLSAATPSRAEDITELISQYRREHGLPTVKTDERLMAIAERQAKAMAASGIMDHSVDGPFETRISGANLAEAGENIAAGTKTWEDTLRMWEKSPGHNRNLLTPRADLLGVAVARNDNTRYKVYWAMVIGRRDNIRHRGSKPAVVAAKDGASKSGTSKSGTSKGGTSRSGTSQSAATAPAAASSVGQWMDETITSIKSLLP